MTYTAKDREELAKARAICKRLPTLEGEAVGNVTQVMFDAGLRLAGENDTWAGIALDHAQAIRDALAPFDDGTRPAQDARKVTQ